MCCPAGSVLEYIVNFREGDVLPGGPGDLRIGEVRYASSRRHAQAASVPLYVSALDYLGKRTGKSNTVKMIIQATAELAASGATLKVPRCKGWRSSNAYLHLPNPNGC